MALPDGRLTRGWSETTPGTEPLLLYLAMNLVVFFLYAFDKVRAAVRGGRISESTLMLAAAAGPFGAIAAIVFLRHKTRHQKFLLVPVFAFLHLLLAGSLYFFP